jgi:hypothetical protein
VGPGTAGRPGSGPTPPPRRWGHCPPEQIGSLQIMSFSLCMYGTCVLVDSGVDPDPHQIER